MSRLKLDRDPFILCRVQIFGQYTINQYILQNTVEIIHKDFFSMRKEEQMKRKLGDSQRYRKCPSQNGHLGINTNLECIFGDLQEDRLIKLHNGDGIRCCVLCCPSMR
jgi:hypothetical protein